MNRIFGAGLACLLSIAFAGCGGPSVSPPPSYSPDAVTRDALALYDTNKDGKLDAAELKKCRALADSLAEIDKNGDKCIDTEELTARIATYAASKSWLRGGVRPRVMRGERPVEGVTVTLEPEKFMAGIIKPATGVSNETGDVVLQTEGQPFEGTQIGFFQVIVSKKDASGKELIPAKYNNPTTLGVEIAPSNRFNLSIDLDK